VPLICQPPVRKSTPETEAEPTTVGWLAVAETHPALMARYLERVRGADPITKARAHNEIFPAPIREVSQRFLARYAFPEIVLTTVAGRTGCNRIWYDCLANASRIAQALAFFDCLQVPDSCREEWRRWQGLASA
jgi:hypothetical protein